MLREERTAELRRRSFFSDKPIAAAKSETEIAKLLFGITESERLFN
jgi:hypothetical protein